MSKSVCFTGHRPNKLYGYDLMDKRYIKLYNIIKDYCKEIIEGMVMIHFILEGH